MNIEATEAWASLEAHAREIERTHLRELLADAERCRRMCVEAEGIRLDFSRQNATLETIGKLLELAEAAQLRDKIAAMFRGERINTTENRAVLHVALRAPKGASILLDGANVVDQVHAVLDEIRTFSAQVRSGEWTGATGKPLKDVVAIGIGGSYLGPEFVHEAFRTDPDCARAAEGRRLRFLANVDPIDVERNLDGLNPETTLVVVISKTFTTAETMLNARTLRDWLTKALGPEAVKNGSHHNSPH